MEDVIFSSQFRSIVVKLQREYMEQLAGQLENFRRTEALLRAKALPLEELQKLYRLSHDFAGSGTTFGFPAISETARALHTQMKAVVDDPATAGAAHDAAVLALMQAFVGAVADGAAMSWDEAETHLVLPQAPELLLETEADDIYFLTEGGGRAAALAEEIRHFGYSVITDAAPDVLRDAVEKGALKALVAFNDMSERGVAEVSAIYETAMKRNGVSVPFIVVCPHDDFAARLSAARLGAQGFFAGEADVLALIERIEQLDMKFSMPPRYNIMIVDDDKMLTEFYNHTLTRTGMNVTTLSDPQEAVEQLSKKQIDLLLVDYSMPGCNGQELAAVIRQFDKYISMPIVFISSYEDLEKAVVDTGLGIDDFLVKPFTPDRLYAVVRSRAQRAAELKSFMTRDSFTGLLNHTHFNESLEQELARVRRGKRLSCYVMLDLDHFKSINDTYGHAAGDQVIKSISRMLQQQLRRSDVIGRCGGEEFGVILPECPLDKAQEIIEKVRIAFSESFFTFGDKKIYVTFSSGIVRVDKDRDVDYLLKAADAALYRAKEAGRNCIRTYEE